MKVFKFIYKATLCATLSATVLTSCVNNWLDLEPADGVEEKEGITNSDNMGTAVAGLYAGLKGNSTLIDYYGANMFLYGDVHADDMQSYGFILKQPKFSRLFCSNKKSLP